MKIISGGQTGADRTFLEIARELGIPTGGYIPLGWRTDEGPDPSLATFGCVQSWSPSYRVRTRQNAREADGTVWFGRTDSPGYFCTWSACQSFVKPFLENPSVDDLLVWLQVNYIRVMNGAGNRRRTNPGIVEEVRAVMKPTLELLCELEPEQ